MRNSTAIILILVSLGVFYTFINPQYQEVVELQSLAGDYRNVLDNVSIISETRDQLISSYRNIPTSEIERLSKVLPDKADAVRLALDLDTIASNHGITIDQVSVFTGNEQGASIIRQDNSGPYKITPVSITFVSNYQNFAGFLEDLEKSLRLLDVKSIVFDTNESTVYEHQITIEVYSLE